MSQDEIFFCFLSVGETEGPEGVDKSVILIPFGETQNLSVPNTPDTTSVGVKKLWMNQFLEEDKAKSGTQVTVKIKQTASYDKAGKLVARDDEGNKQVKYYPDETTVFTATKNDNIWMLSTGNNTVNIDSTGRVIELPTVTVTEKGVPLYYTYTVEETPVPDNYTAIYTEEKGADGTTVTITNRPKDIMSTVNVKAKKVWVDANNKDITSEMGVKDGVTVEVYRREGVLNVGTIYDGEVKKSASDLFAMILGTLNGDQAQQGHSFTQPAIVVLPGDEIRVTIYPTYIENKTVENIGFAVTLAGSIDTGGNASGSQSKVNNPTIDSDAGALYYTFTADKQYGAIGIKAEQSYVSSYSVSLENLSAKNRTHVLKQNEASSLNDSIVQTLDLNITNRWQNTSRDFPSGSGGTIYTYYVVEPSNIGSAYDAEYTMSGDSVVVKNIDKRLRVEKKWFHPDGKTQLEVIEGSITYDLYQVTSKTEWQENYTGTGEYGVSANFQYKDGSNNDKQRCTLNWSTEPPTKIKPGSEVEVTLTIKNKGNEEQYLGEHTVIRVNGGTPEIFRTESKDGNRVKKIVIHNVASDISLSGIIEVNSDDTEVFIEARVIREPGVPVTEDTTGNKIGTVTMTYDDASIELDESFAESGIFVAPGKEHWSSIISKLPSGSTDVSGAPVTYTYRVVETSWPDSFDQMSVEPNGAVSNSGTVTISNKAKPAKVRVTKAFVGLEASDIPADFKITNDQNDEVFTVENANGNGTKDNPYYWEIDNLMEGTRVTFYETGVVVDGKELRIEANGKASNDGHASAVAAIVTGTESVPTARLVNDYSAAKGALKFTKKVTVNGNAIENVSEELKKAADGKFTFTVTGPDEKLVATVIFTITDGQVTSATRDGDAVTLDDNKYVTIKDLDLGEYTVTETVTGAFTLSNITGGKEDSADKANKKVTLTVAAGETIEKEAQAIFTNNLAVTGFEFSKVWLAMTAGAGASDFSSNDLKPWPSGKSISVNVFRKNGDNNTAIKNENFELVYEIKDSGNTVSLKSGKINNEEITGVEKAKYQLTRTVNDNIATFSIGPVLDVEKDGTPWVYYVEETSVPEGYLKDGYGTMSTAVGTGTTISKAPGAEAAAKGEVILNRESSGYELPQTGGIGTTLFTALGGLMTATAGAILTIKSWHRRKENA